MRDPRRSLAVVIAERDGVALGFNPPAGLPLGPWPTLEEAHAALSAFGYRKGFKIIKYGRFYVATSCAGAKRYFRCAYANAVPSQAVKKQTSCMGQHGHKCGFKIDLEETLGGWAIRKGCNFSHSAHAFFEPKDEAVAAALAEDGKIPESLRELALTLRRANSSAQQIDRVLTSAAAEKGIPKTWVWEDVYNSFCRDGAAENLFDAHFFCQTLRQREREHGLAYEILLAEDAELLAAFWVADGGVELWAMLRGAKVMLYDTKHGTNKYKYKLGCFTVLDFDGNTRIAAYSLIEEGEKKESFDWAFRQFAKHLSAPSVIFTDGDIGMAGAIAAVLTPLGTVHLLCMYHVYTNLFKHMRKFFADKKLWHAFVDTFWKIAKRTDIRSVPAFAEEWSELTRLVPQSAARSASKELAQAIEWLRSLGTRAPKWASRWTWQRLTLMVHSTQRAEAIHSALAHIISSADNVSKLLEKLEAFGENHLLIKGRKAERSALVQVSSRAPRAC